MSVLTVENIRRIFEDCLLRPHLGEEGLACITTVGLTRTKAFHFHRLAAHNAEICAMLDELPRDFKSEVGQPFSEAHWSEGGCLWTNMDDLVLEQLIMLGVAVDKVSWCHPPDEKPTTVSRFRVK